MTKEVRSQSTIRPADGKPPAFDDLLDAIDAEGRVELDRQDAGDRARGRRPHPRSWPVPKPKHPEAPPPATLSRAEPQPALVQGTFDFDGDCPPEEPRRPDGRILGQLELRKHIRGGGQA